MGQIPNSLMDVTTSLGGMPEPGDPASFAAANGGSGVSSAAAAGGGGGGVIQRTEEYYDSQDTTSFSVLDSQGNAVCCTPTIGEGFGTRVVVGDTGLIFNNGMRIGSTSPYPSNVNYVRPGGTALLNNSPLIVMKDGQLICTLGTPGGEVQHTLHRLHKRGN